ncbi:MAG: transposase [Candidatus Amoebophilus sp.]
MMSYLSDLTDKQWFLIKDYFDQGNYGKSRKYSQRMLINEVFYLIKTGCQWCFLPKITPLENSL